MEPSGNTEFVPFHRMFQKMSPLLMRLRIGDRYGNAKEICLFRKIVISESLLQVAYNAYLSVQINLKKINLRLEALIHSGN